jgi:hypothetical protein
VFNLPNGFVWACPECLGDLSVPQQPDITRCVGCGRTLDEFVTQSRKAGEVTLLTDMVCADTEYYRGAFIDFEEVYLEYNDDPS